MSERVVAALALRERIRDIKANLDIYLNSLWALELSMTDEEIAQYDAYVASEKGEV